MHDFLKLKNELIKLIKDNCLLLFDGQKRSISVIFTNYRLILLDYPNYDYKEVLKISKGMDHLKKKIFSINLSSISMIEKDKFDKYILNDGNYFRLKTN